ncbi:MAG: right-handed parallel beta-helix repeat-containing protein, partial [Bacteroidales bacterium]|nr:right-handed parallel beta-helix repeat-containing protein [Bacteroidales bacterium]
GDNIGSKFNLGISVPTMFNKASLWNKAAYNNHYHKESRKPLETLFQDFTNDEHKLLDKKSFVNLMLYIDLTSSYHHDNQHNWILYYDNYYEKFYPIIWDSMGWQPSWMAKKSIHLMHSSELMRSLYRNYDFLKEKYYQLRSFNLKARTNFLTTLDNEVEKVTEKVERLKYTFTPHGKYRDVKKTLKALKSLQRRVIDRINYVEKELLGDANVSDYKYSDLKNGIRLSINGNKLITKIKLNVNNIDNLGNAYISYYVNNIEKKNKINYMVNSKDKSIEFNIHLLAKTNEILGKPYPGSKSIEFSNATYDIAIENLEKVDSVSLEYLSKKNNHIKVSKENDILSTSFDYQFNVISQPEKQAVEIWSGTKVFSGFTLIKNDLTIEKGTRIIFDKNATLKILGKVTAIGTKENPIVFEAKDKTNPWNTLALKDEKANGSIFKHCIFKDGSGDKGDLYEYTAMFSVHNVKDLLVEDCEFYDSHRTDDMVHVIYSDATFKNTKFVRSLSDALDVDISNLVVDNCEFIDSGNDSIDLMTTNAVVVNTKFTNSKDKGISIGEGSNLLAINNHIQGSEIGMQSKDTSQAYIYNTSFIGNKKAIDAYHKNWR